MEVVFPMIFLVHFLLHRVLNLIIDDGTNEPKMLPTIFYTWNLPHIGTINTYSSAHAS